MQLASKRTALALACMHTALIPYFQCVNPCWAQEAEGQGGRRLLHAGHDAAVLHDAAWQARHRTYLVHKYVGISIFVAVTLQVRSVRGVCALGQPVSPAARSQMCP